MCDELFVTVETSENFNPVERTFHLSLTVHLPNGDVAERRYEPWRLVVEDHEVYGYTYHDYNLVSDHYPETVSVPFNPTFIKGSLEMYHSRDADFRDFVLGAIRGAGFEPLPWYISRRDRKLSVRDKICVTRIGEPLAR